MQLAEAKGHFKIASWGKHVVMQIKSPEGEKITCFFGDKKTSQGELLRAGTALGLVGFCMILPVVHETAALFAMISLFMVGISGPVQGDIFTDAEVMKEKRKSLNRKKYASVSFSIDQKKFDEMKADLLKKRFYIYSTLFHNCSDKALNFGRKHGFDLPRGILKTPLILRLQIRARQRRASKAIQAP